MAEPFKNREEIEAWLETQPREVISVFAARAAMRVVPNFVRLIDNKNLTLSPSAIILPSLWAIVTALSAGKWPDKAVELRAAAYAAAAAAAADADVAAAAVHAAAYAAYAAYAAVVADAAYAAAAAADAADAAYAAYAEYSWDRDFIDNHGSAGVNQLAQQPLWHLGFPPEGSPLKKDWDILKDYLHALDEDWEVWTEWYDYLLTGDPSLAAGVGYSVEVEIGIDPENGQYGRATLPKEFYKNPAKANAAIKEIIEVYKKRQEALEQDPTVETFDITEDGEINLSTETIGTGLLAAPSQKDWYEELRSAVDDATALGQNKLGSAASPLSRFSDALPENIDAAKVAKIWPRANRLRRLIKRNNSIPDGEFDSDRLDPDVADSLNTIVEVYNNLRIGDPSLMAADENAISPQDAEEIITEIEDLQPFLEEVLAEAVIQPDAAESLQEIVDLDITDISLQNDIMGRLEVAEKKKRLRNFVARAVRYVQDQPHKAAGAAVLTEMTVKYSDQLLSFLGLLLKSLL